MKAIFFPHHSDGWQPQDENGNFTGWVVLYPIQEGQGHDEWLNAAKKDVMEYDHFSREGAEAFCKAHALPKEWITQAQDVLNAS